MGKIAKWSEVNSRIGSSGNPPNKCPTKSEIVTTGKGVVKGSYSNEQAVQLEDISKQGTLSGCFFVNNDAYDYGCGWMFECINNGGEGENLSDTAIYVGTIDWIDLTPNWEDSTSYNVRITTLSNSFLILNNGESRTYIDDKKCDVTVIYTDESGISHKNTYTNVTYNTIDYNVTGSSIQVIVNVKL